MERAPSGCAESRDLLRLEISAFHTPLQGADLLMSDHLEPVITGPQGWLRLPRQVSLATYGVVADFVYGVHQGRGLCRLCANRQRRNAGLQAGGLPGSRRIPETFAERV